ncbi:DEAD/DEAH box helicase [Mycolicibacterium goodii]|uniref:DEAD/DEAH box helicase n=2 Tax=Mycolicibacterium goodii TaxID=134601 RepID=A0ABS6HWN9_MYCGD|nr:SNF2-related protein [Mycolicibacterium goodii]MBU8827083.1 DEAD/DEAH box helicase [Mycolicibacterium goodii]MBU8840789.1 DEAD/DEAH box helicase [Mycolicibacterium goodii]
MIEKPITHQLLETGELALTEREAQALSLPEHSTTITLELEDDEFHAQWSGRGRHLTGDMLAERLQDYGQEGGLLRLSLVNQVYRLTLLEPGSKLTDRPKPPRPPVNVSKPKPKTKVERRRTVDRQFHADTEYDWGTGPNNTIGFLKDARALLGEQLKAAGFDPFELVELRLQGEELATLDDFEELLAVDVANVDRMPHQEAVARHALSRLRGRAVLADEVGLGKTVEAGLAIKELTLRGLAKRVLILCPAPLRDQWREEMSHKFDLDFDVAYRGADVRKQDKLILSLTLGRSAAEKLTKTPWDIVILDEAHRAAGEGARKTRELITSLTTACRYAFFLTATPVQNNLLELYRLVELLRPGTFTSVHAFKRQFMMSHDPRTPNDPAALRRLISSAMIRTTRAQAGVDRVKRVAVDVPVDLGTRERELYALATELLRNVMRDPGDTMRRRSLALRLTASPFAMGTTAFRMAEKHSNPRVQEVLNEIGHLAMDIQRSAREDAAIDITRKWLREHGRVLIFTQHTDSVTGLLKRMEIEGLTACSFHGSMSAGERAKTIAAFRSGDAPIMISTDAGAEGQNLQFCNCVLNFDLPWNPMRIEQRIGRVDRLTQPKDQVFVANLYARQTIDESVYRLLAEKLKMFELLFGQVTTILGELDDSKSATFESRVLEALFADNDSKMNGLLSQLGTELAHARERASNLIAADSNMSNWMAEAFEHRKNLTKAGATELMPEVSERARIRQRRVQTWARDVLKALNAEILHDTGEGDGAFITAQFDEEFEEELGGRTVMHLAFDRYGLEHHPDAELCAVGSPVFDELLRLLRMRGDMHAAVPVVPDEIGPSPYRHAPFMKLVRRSLVPSGSWSGHATFRATVGEAETSEHLITADINGHHQQRLPRRPLLDGESLPAAFDTAAKVIESFEKSAASQLEALRRERAEQVEAEQAFELERITNGYRAQIAEAHPDDRARLRRALNSEERRLTRRPDIRARAKLLALVLDEDDWLVSETWEGPNGSEGTLTYEWGLSEPPIIESDYSDEPIRVLAMCCASHWVDESETTHCQSCDRVLCEACGDEAIFADCPLCGMSTCGACRKETKGLCHPCASPQRAPELDEEYAVAWKLNSGTTLFVGQRVAELVRPGGWSTTLVLDEDLTDTARARMRSYAKQHSLPLDSGLVLRDLTARRDQDDPNRVRLTSTEHVAVELSIADTATPTIDASAIRDLPDSGEVTVSTECEFHADDLLAKLRRQEPPTPPPAVLLTRRSTFDDIYLESMGLLQELSAVTDDGAIEISDLRSADLEWLEPSTDNARIASAELAGVRVSLYRRNEAVLIVATKVQGSWEKRWIACPEKLSAAHQLGCFDYLFSIGMPGGRLGKRADEARTIVAPFPTPHECELDTRDIRPVSELVELDSSSQLIEADEISMEALGIKPDVAGAKQMLAVPSELSAALLARAERSFTTALWTGLEVTETWRGHGTATHTYRTFDGEPVYPKLDDIGIRGTDFGVCRDGHFYAAEAAALCGACQTWACRACDDVEHQASVSCPSCTTSVCRRCLSADHLVPTDRCLLCGDHACADCGRDPHVHACPTCDRPICAGCRVDETCPACAELRAATDTELESLPAVLATSGVSALIGADSDATVVLLCRGETFERALVRNDSVIEWIAFGRNEIDSPYRLRLAASLSLRQQVKPQTAALRPETVFTEPHLVVESERSYHVSWSVPALEVSGRSAAQFDAPDGDLPTPVSSEFPALSRVPEPVTTAGPALARIFETMEQPRTVDMIVRWERFGHDLAITPKGMCDLVFGEAEDRISVFGWDTPNEGYPRWVADSWNPAPTVRRHADTDGAAAVIVNVASLLALGVRVGGQETWYSITSSENAAAATTLSRWMGLGDADKVSVFTDPRKVKLSTVANATETMRDVRPIGSTKVGALTHSDSSREALSAWLPDAEIKLPELHELPHQVSTALKHAAGGLPPRTDLQIGARIQQRVTVESGQQWSFDRTLAAGQADARWVSSISGDLLNSGVIDREGHFGIECPPCLYCGGRTCSVCVQGIVACDCCGVPICKRCVGEPRDSLYLCPACLSMRPPTRTEARQHGRLLSTRRMLIGIDDVHTVVVEQSKNQWARRDGDTKHPVANPSAANYLNERLVHDG